MPLFDIPLLGHVFALCDKCDFLCCTRKVVLTKMCQDYLGLDVSNFTQLVDCPHRDISGSSWNRLSGRGTLHHI